MFFFFGCFLVLTFFVQKHDQSNLQKINPIKAKGI
jgi:preprotein translocase subunit SecG